MLNFGSIKEHAAIYWSTFMIWYMIQYTC